MIIEANPADAATHAIAANPVHALGPDTRTMHCTRCGAMTNMPVGIKSFFPADWAIITSDTGNIILCPDCVTSQRASAPTTKAQALPRANGGHPTEASPDAWFLAATGSLINLTSPAETMFNIVDIAIALSRMPRFNGHTTAARNAYTVAEHSVWVSYRCPPHLALAGLLHDATEAYLGDVISPLKAVLPGYREIEHRMARVIAKAFHVEGLFDEQVKSADIAMGVIEARRLMPHNPAYWGTAEDDESQTISCWGEEEAMRRFLERYYELTLPKVPHQVNMASAEFMRAIPSVAPQKVAA